MKTVLLMGPSFELAGAARAAWVRRQIRKHVPSFLVGVDGGIRFLRGQGALRPDLLIGDWDSGKIADARRLARQGARQGTRIVTLPRKKDFSDLSFALGAVAEITRNGRAMPRELLLLGFTGGRPDHLLANLFEIAEFAAAHAGRVKFQKIAAIGPEAEYHFLTHRQPPLELIRGPRVKAGAPVSVFALGGPVRGVTMTGFEYSLKNALLKPSSRGLSNTARARRARIRVGRGTLLVVIPRGR